MDMAIGGISMSPVRSQAVDFLVQHAQEPTVLVFQLHTRRDLFFLGLFHWRVWLLILILPVIVLLYHLLVVSIHRKPLRQSSGSDFLCLFGNLVGQGIIPSN